MLKILTVVMLATVILLAGQPGATNAQAETITPGTPITGTLTGSEQAYTLDASAGNLLLISLDSATFDTTVALKGVGGSDLASDDDGGEGSNSLLAYVAQADESLQVIVDGWSDPSGEFTLNVEVIDPTIVEVGGTVNLAPEGHPNVYTVFSGTADSVVNISAASLGDDDLRMTLVGVDAMEIESDDDDGPGTSPLLRRVVLPADGLYLIKANAIFDDIPTANVDISVEATERLFIDATPQSLSLSDDGLGTEVYTFEATAGSTYRTVVTSVNGSGIRLEMLDTDAFFTPDLDAGDAVRVSWDYRATVNGMFRLVVHPSFFSDGDEYQISVEIIE